MAWKRGSNWSDEEIATLVEASRSAVGSAVLYARLAAQLGRTVNAVHTRWRVMALPTARRLDKLGPEAAPEPEKPPVPRFSNQWAGFTRKPSGKLASTPKEPRS
jgi:hypothetical protein